MNQWRPEREITIDEATDAVRELGLAGNDVRQVAQGWDNSVIAVDGEWLFRFPRRKIALPGVEREAVHLNRIAPLLPLPIPQPQHQGTYGDPPWPFWGAHTLPGTELAVSPHADYPSVAAQMGAFLQSLHQIETDDSLPVDPIERGDVATRAVRARETLAGLAEKGIWTSKPEVEELLTEAEATPPPDLPLVTTHGDLYARHVLVDKQGQVSGVIDWGDICLAPASVDLSFAWSALPPEHRPALFDAYGEIDDDTRLRARVLAVNLLTYVAAYAHDSKLDKLLASALTRLDTVAVD